MVHPIILGARRGHRARTVTNGEVLGTIQARTCVRRNATTTTRAIGTTTLASVLAFQLVQWIGFSRKIKEETRLGPALSE
jgi:hypothetical protein